VQRVQSYVFQSRFFFMCTLAAEGMPGVAAPSAALVLFDRTPKGGGACCCVSRLAPKVVLLFCVGVLFGVCAVFRLGGRQDGNERPQRVWLE